MLSLFDSEILPVLYPGFSAGFNESLNTTVMCRIIQIMICPLPGNKLFVFFLLVYLKGSISMPTHPCRSCDF